MKKKEIILIACLGLLALVYLFMRNDGRIGYELPEWKTVESDKISSLSYGRERDLNTLDHSGDLWLLPGGEKADPDRMRRITDVLGELTILDKLSDREDYSRYKLDDSEATKLEIVIGDETREIFFGKQAAGGGTYVRFPGMTGVYSVNRDLTTLFPADPMELRDREVLSFDAAALQSLSLTRGDKTVSLKKTDGKWFRDGAEADEKDPLVQMLPALTSLKCARFLDEAAAGDVLLELRLIGEKNQTLYVYDATDDGYRAASSDADGMFILSKYIVDGWLKLFES